METYSPTNLPSPYGNIFLTVSEKQICLKKFSISQAQPAFIFSNSAILTVEKNAKYV